MMSGGVLIQSSGVSLTTLKDGKMIEFDSASVARVTPEQADELLNREAIGGEKLYFLAGGKTASGVTDKTPGSFNRLVEEIRKLTRDGRITELTRFLRDALSKSESLLQDFQQKNIDTSTLQETAKALGKRVVDDEKMSESSQRLLDSVNENIVKGTQSEGLARKDAARDGTLEEISGKFEIKDKNTGQSRVIDLSEANDDNLTVDGVKKGVDSLALEREKIRDKVRQKRIKKVSLKKKVMGLDRG